MLIYSSYLVAHLKYRGRSEYPEEFFINGKLLGVFNLLLGHERRETTCSCGESFTCPADNPGGTKVRNLRKLVSILLIMVASLGVAAPAPILGHGYYNLNECWSNRVNDGGHARVHAVFFDGPEYIMLGEDCNSDANMRDGVGNYGDNAANKVDAIILNGMPDKARCFFVYKEENYTGGAAHRLVGADAHIHWDLSDAMSNNIESFNQKALTSLPPFC
jgi:hypothetical protein